MTTWLNLVAVAIGGAGGAVLRHLITVAAIAILGGSGVLRTALANALGCAAIGGLGEYCLINEAVHYRVILALRVGFLGSLTTFSTFAADSIGLASSD